MDHFIVSARKYRPAVFMSVVGQSHITSTLKNAISRNQLAHAYLFCGPRGVGKTTCARIFAKSINCLSPKDSEACGECESCRAFNEERSFNIHELDAASNNSVDDIRSLTEQVRIPPQIGRYSVYIIDEVHMLSAAAFNAFLKTLEEPPAHAVFILATTEKHKIIPTILSRCQIYDFNRIRVEDSVEYLKYVARSEEVEADDESLNLIAQKADGGMRDALSMFDKAVSFCGKSLCFREVAQTLNVLDYDSYFGITDMIYAGDYPAVLLAFDGVLGKGFSGQTFLTGLSAHFRDLLMCKNPQTLPLLEITGSLMERYRQQAAALDVQFLFGGIALLAELESSFRTALNQRLHVELGLMKMCGTGQKKNDGLNASPVPLPELERGGSETAVTRPAPQQPQQSQQPQPERQSAPEPSGPLKQSAAQEPPASPEPSASSESSVSLESSVSPESSAPPEPFVSPASEPVPQATPTIPAAPAAPAAPKSTASPISGASITSILNAPKRSYGRQADTPEKNPEESIDPDCEKKIKQFAARFFHSMQAEHPRVAPAFETMEVAVNTVSVKAHSQEIHDEIVRNRQEILDMLAAIAGVTGTIVMEVSITENHGAKKPIKVEDRLRFLTGKNPLVAKLRKELDFDIE